MTKIANLYVESTEEFKQRLIDHIENPKPHPLVKPLTYSDQIELNQLNPEAMSEERLSEFQSHGWFTGFVYNRELYQEHQDRLNTLTKPDSQ